LLLLLLLLWVSWTAALYLGVQRLGGGLRRRRLGVRGQPAGEWAALLGVVVAQDAADVGVVFSVAVGLGREQRRAQRRDLRRRLGQEIGVPGRHGEEVGFGACALRLRVLLFSRVIPWQDPIMS
jgi:hypothetical protein